MIEGREKFQVAAEPLTVSCPVRVEAGICTDVIAGPVIC